MKRFIKLHQGSLTIAVLGLGLFLRLLVAASGFTYDMESYEIVGRAVLEGKNVYAETTRYNYGPVWFFLVGFLYKISLLFEQSFFIFRYMVAFFLAVIDVALFFVLASLFSRRIAYLYYFNPLSILITGFYSQFDNVALLIGFIALGRMVKGMNVKKEADGVALLLLGLSLTVKHILFMFPFWLFLRQKTWRNRLMVLTVPIGIFLASFLPYMRDGFQGIVDNVFLYRSFDNAPFWHAVVPDALKRFIDPSVLFLTALVVGGWVARKWPLAITLPWYGILLVLFSPAVSEQYFVIVLPFIALFPNIFFVAFTVVSTVFLIVTVSGGEMYAAPLGMRLDRQTLGFGLQTQLLLSGFLWTIVRRRIYSLDMRQWMITLSTLLLVLTATVWIPSAHEDMTVAKIEKALASGDYELANMLYNETQKNPPFAGSRFWNKLKKSRENVEFYRNFVKARDLYQRQPTSESRDVIREYLRKPPINFALMDEAEEMLRYANDPVK